MPSLRMHGILCDPVGGLAASLADTAACAAVMPALSALKARGIRLAIATSLPSDAVTRCIETAGLQDVFAVVCTGDPPPLEEALTAMSLERATRHEHSEARV